MIVPHAITRDDTIDGLCRQLATTSTPVAASGLWGSAAPILAAAVAGAIQRPLLFLTPHINQADDARDDIETTTGRPAELLPAWETLPGEGSGAGEITAERSRLCAALLDRRTNPQAASRASQPEAQVPYCVAPAQALMQPVPSPAHIEASALTLHVDQQLEPHEITRWLVDRGFERLDRVEQPGDFALRGGILDVFATADVDPVRIEFFGDRIESIRPFDIGSQRSIRTLSATRITVPPDPASVAAEDTTSFLDYLAPETLVVLHEPIEIIEIARTVLARLGNPIGHTPIDALLKRLGRFGQLHLTRFAGATVEDRNVFAVHCEPLPTFDTRSSDAVRELVLLAKKQTVVVYCDNRGEQQRLSELVDQGLGSAQDAEIEMRIGLIHQGFQWRTARPDADGIAFAVVPHHELFRRYTQKRRIRRVTAARPIDSFIDLNDGDFVVHLTHGIGQYVGMKTMRKGQSHKSEEYLTLRFADKATVHVPVSQIDLVQKYVGSRGARPALSKLGGTRWKSTREKVEQAVDDLAADLLRIQAVRESQPGIAFPQDTHWQTEFEDAFQFTETPDQIAAIRDVKSDMMRPRPMDRLLCGDVGYGKTELAMRAAFKTVEFGRQVAVLVPTTVLAEQHNRTFTERMADYPFVIECLNRFRPAKQQRQIIARARKGQVDILIGTHRLVSKDVGFADLGLVIIDEEQRFGVEHKERLKRLRTTVDVLTLTATPIPRTLHMSMIGLRDISSLATPPMDRRAISTRVVTWDDRLIREAIIRELNRDGQVYFVHNRVQSIERIANAVRSLVPDARVLIGHGQMPGEQLEDVMRRFVNRRADVLVCTNIIESGLDIPTANTILIDRADRFGLADLHQLRGRVGRYRHRAYCYLLLHPKRPITSVATRRLKAIEQYSDLGAGFRIAMRDLEIRGAGNLLGQEQSGHIAAVGYELYCQLLEKGVKRMKGEPCRDRVAVHLELDVEAHIPRGYIPSDRQRMECYRRVAACQTPQDVEQLAADLRDAFGRYPETVDTLLTLADIKVRAAAWNIKTIIKKEPDLIFKLDGAVKHLEPLFADSKGQISFPDPKTLYWRLPDNCFHGDTLLTILRDLFRKTAPANPTATSQVLGHDSVKG
ncbi:MAG: transcription-repair coupling factor [Phycisphaerae bacterium]